MTKKPNVSTSMADIPNMIQEILPVWQSEIDRLQTASIEGLSREDIRLSLQLMTALTSTYTMYRVLKAEAKQAVQSRSPTELAATLQNLLLSAPKPTMKVS